MLARQHQLINKALRSAVSTKQSSMFASGTTLRRANFSEVATQAAQEAAASIDT